MIWDEMIYDVVTPSNTRFGHAEAIERKLGIWLERILNKCSNVWLCTMSAVLFFG